MKKILILVLVLVASISVPVSLFADVTAIINGKIVIGNGTVYENGIILIENEIIKAVGDNVEIPGGANIIDAKGMVVWPGMIDPFTTVGLVEVSAVQMTNDSNEATSTNTAHLLASHGINPDSVPIAVTRNNGITTALVIQGTRNPINGQAAIINLEGRLVSEMLVKDKVAITLNFGARRSDSYPSTRPGVVAFIRQTLLDVQQYGEKKEKSDSDKKDEKNNKNSQSIDLNKEVLLSVLKGEMPVLVGGNSIQDISNALAVGKEFNLKMILTNPREAWKLIDEIKASGYPVLLGNTFNLPGERDPYDRYYKMAAALYEAGIAFAFTSSSAHGVRGLPDIAAMSVTFGLPETEAVKALTLYPAKIIGIDDNYGTLAAGKIANVAIWDGNPLQITSRVKQLFIKGKKVSLISRQEMLKKKFEEVGKGK